MVWHRCKCGWQSYGDGNFCTSIDFWNAPKELREKAEKLTAFRLCCKCAEPVESDYSDEED